MLCISLVQKNIQVTFPIWLPLVVTREHTLSAGGGKYVRRHGNAEADLQNEQEAFATRQTQEENGTCKFFPQLYLYTDCPPKNYNRTFSINIFRNCELTCVNSSSFSCQFQKPRGAVRELFKSKVMALSMCLLIVLW